MPHPVHILYGFYPRDASQRWYQLSSCVCPSVCPSQVDGVLLKRLNAGSRKQRHTIVRRLCFLTPKISAKSDWVSTQPQTEAPFRANCRWGRLNAAGVQLHDLPCCSASRWVCHRQVILVETAYIGLASYWPKISHFPTPCVFGAPGSIRDDPCVGVSANALSLENLIPWTL